MKTLARTGKRGKPLLRPWDGCAVCRDPRRADERIGADPEARARDAQFWKTAKAVLPTPKEIVTMRLDADLLRWFRREPGYQTRINAILRAYMEAQESA